MTTDIQALEKQYESAKSRLSEQRDTFKTFSNEGVKVIRVLLLLITAPAAILGAFNYSTLLRLLSYLTSNSTATIVITSPVPVSLISTIGVLGLLVASLMHLVAAGFDARGIRTATNPNDLYRSVSEGWSEREHLEEMLDMYMLRIDQNDRVLNELESFLAIGKVGLALTITCVGLIVISVLYRPINLLWCAPLPIAFYVIYRRIPEPYRRADSGGEFTPPYPCDYESYMSEISEGSSLDNHPTSSSGSDEKSVDSENHEDEKSRNTTSSVD